MEFLNELKKTNWKAESERHRNHSEKVGSTQEISLIFHLDNGKGAA